jgi:uncharacterized protein YegL
VSSDLQLRTAVIDKILKMHEELLWPCTDRWIAWRPTDYLAELRRLRAQHNPDAAIRLRLPSLDDPSFFFWSIFNTQDDVFPELNSHTRVSLRRIIGIRNAGVHGERVTSDSLDYLNYCVAELLQILAPAHQSKSAAGGTPALLAPEPSTAPSPTFPTPNTSTTTQSPLQTSAQQSMTQILAFYVVCDKSASMAGDPVDVVNHSLSEMHRELISDPVIADKCWMSVVSFSSTAMLELPLTPPHQVVSMPRIDAEGITNYGSAFSLVKSQIDIDLPRLTQTHRPFRPVVFFMTDGSPSDATWKDELIRLVDAGETFAPTVVVIPVGDVDETVLSEFTNVPTGITPHILRLRGGADLSASVRRAIQSMTSSVINTLRSDDDILSIAGLDTSFDIGVEADEQF